MTYVEYIQKLYESINSLQQQSIQKITDLQSNLIKIDNKLYPKSNDLIGIDVQQPSTTAFEISQSELAILRLELQSSTESSTPNINELLIDTNSIDICTSTETTSNVEFSKSDITTATCPIVVDEQQPTIPNIDDIKDQTNIHDQQIPDITNAIGSISESPTEDFTVVDQLFDDLKNQNEEILNSIKNTITDQFSEIALESLMGEYSDVDGVLSCIKSVWNICKSMMSSTTQLAELTDQLGQLRLTQHYQQLILTFYETRYHGYVSSYSLISDSLKKINTINAKLHTFDPLDTNLTNDPIIAQYKRDIQTLLSTTEKTLSNGILLTSVDDFINRLSQTLFSFSNELHIKFNGYASTINISKMNILSGAVKTYSDTLQSIPTSIQQNSTVDVQTIINDADNTLNEIKNSIQHNIEQLAIESVYAILHNQLFGIESQTVNWLETFKQEVVDSTSNLESTSQKISDIETAIENTKKSMNNAISETTNSLKTSGCSHDDSIRYSDSIDSIVGIDITYHDIPKSLSESPSMLQKKWWDKFAELATIINLLPIYWPVGLLIPTPAGILKIPMPIIWKTVSVQALPTALIVVFVGQCGILPSPFVLIINTSDIPIGSINPKSAMFPVAIRPMVTIKNSVGSNVIPAIPILTISGFDINADPDFTKTLPLLNDDFPTWERMSLSNFQFLSFLNLWCAAGKRGGGFFEFPF